ERKQALIDHIDFDVVPLDGDLGAGRVYADGRSAYLVRGPGDRVALACFDRRMMFEADLVRVQQLTGAALVQRTAVLDVVRMVLDFGRQLGRAQLADPAVRDGPGRRSGGPGTGAR